MIIELNSVASVFDTETNNVYAKFQNGGYDKNSGANYLFMPMAFIKAMSQDDYNAMADAISKKDEVHFREAVWLEITKQVKTEQTYAV